MRIFWWLYFRFIMTLTYFLPDLRPIQKVRGWLVRPCFRHCGQGLMITHSVQITHTVNVTLGNDVSLAHGVWIMGVGNVTLGDNVGLGPYTVIVTADHVRTKAGYQLAMTRLEPVTIGAGTWIGAHVVILRGVSIGSGCVVSAGSVVDSDVPDECIASGMPARAVRMPPPGFPARPTGASPS